MRAASESRAAVSEMTPEELSAVGRFLSMTHSVMEDMHGSV